MSRRLDDPTANGPDATATERAPRRSGPAGPTAGAADADQLAFDLPLTPDAVRTPPPDLPLAPTPARRATRRGPVRRERRHLPPPVPRSEEDRRIARAGVAEARKRLSRPDAA